MAEETKKYPDGLEGIKEHMLDALKEVREEFDKRFKEAKEAGAPLADLKLEFERMQKRWDKVEAEFTRIATVPISQMDDIGSMIIGSETLKEFAKTVRPGSDGFVASKRATFPIKSFAEFPEFAPALNKTTITSGAVGSSTPGILVPERVPGIVKPGVRRFRVRDLMPRHPTTANAIEFVKENALTNAASPVAETVSKGESALTFTIDFETVKTIATWIPAARQLMDDFAALSAYINQRLIEALKDVEDYELVAGDGTGQHLNGLSNEASAYSTGRNVSGDTKLDTLNHAISQIEDVLHTADGIILNPRDFRAMQLIKTEEGGTNKGMYLLGGPAGNYPYPAQGTNSAPVGYIWGLPVALTTAVAVGSFFVGAFQQYTAVWDRMDARIDISTENQDFFIRNMIAIRAEERLAFTLYRSDAVVYGTFPS